MRVQIKFARELEWWIGMWMIVVLVGLGVRLGSEYFNFNKSKSESYAINSLASVPVRVMIPRISLVSQLAPQPIVENDWVIDEDDVNYLVGSGSLDSGNVVLYAHRKPKLFGDLHKVGEGDVITVTGSGDGVVYYQVFESYSTTAGDLSILNNSEESMLTLFTCDGWNDTKRWVVKARRF